VNNAIREIAATLGIAVVALAFTSAGSFTNHATVAHGFRAAAGLCAILSVAGALAGALIRTRPEDGNPDRPVPASLIEEATP
jgi:hypothetical protein